jgi:hypothetical protein
MGSFVASSSSWLYSCACSLISCVRVGTDLGFYLHVLFVRNGGVSETRLTVITNGVDGVFSSSPQSISNAAGLRMLALSVILQD